MIRPHLLCRVLPRPGGSEGIGTDLRCLPKGHAQARRCLPLRCRLVRLKTFKFLNKHNTVNARKQPQERFIPKSHGRRAFFTKRPLRCLPYWPSRIQTLVDIKNSHFLDTELNRHWTHTASEKAKLIFKTVEARGDLLQTCQCQLDCRA